MIIDIMIYNHLELDILYNHISVVYGVELEKFKQKGVLNA